MKWYKNPMTVFAAGLGLFAVGAFAYNFRVEVGAQIIAVLLGSGLAFYGLRCWRPQPRHQVLNGVITALIAVLLLNPPFQINGQSLVALCVGGMLVMGAKYAPTYKKMPVFNPVAFGLLLLSALLTLVYGKEAILPTFVSWWGTDFAGWYALIVLLPLIGYAAYKFRKIYLVSTFLLFNALYLLFTDGAEALSYVYASGTIYFMAGVMMLEPKTSPIKMWWQVVAGVLAVLVYRNIGVLGFGNTELWAIVSVNLVHLLSKTGLVKLKL